MATKRLDLTGRLAPTGSCYWAPIGAVLTLGTATGGKELGLVMPDPGGAGDHGGNLNFLMPADYVASPVLRIQGILSGTPANNLGFGFAAKKLADNEAYDAAYGTEDTASASLAGYADEDVYEETVTLTNFASGLTAGDAVDAHFYNDDSVTTFTATFILTSLHLEYSDA